MNDAAYENLRNAIIEQAIKDYREALRNPRIRGISSEFIKSEIIRFFHSKRYALLTDLDSEIILKVLRKAENENTKDSKRKSY
jgi:hypothetical protein